MSAATPEEKEEWMKNIKSVHFVLVVSTSSTVHNLYCKSLLAVASTPPQI